MLNIYFTRHGETQWNIEQRLQGWKNSELTEEGVRNAQLLGERLYQTNFRTIYSSSSERALKTAKIICSDRDIPIHIVDNLKEISFGEWEGKTQVEIEESYEKEYSNFWAMPHEYNHVPHNAESLPDFKLRVEKAIKGIIETNSNGNILIVTHGVVIRAMMSFFLDVPTKNMWDFPIIHGTSLSLVRWNGKQFQKVMLGDTAHMG
ncbi:histidine phosphatase family protein [Anaerobacillus isosaccharinicus]|uniref:phosphoglycerate mutase (2,3-diphosphoglycerate-dependent) n=1 Tax=Anaerobacillus isosaccharinicus TaxID=1532552 RepID=A0A1S2L512_9BACI|nr:histidine phosphatase family protein [Anaerobacillus isosaccharinicus]MBA5588740.1 histidine phosphatase family protein [Anaerobacillus isosaccharinicus]QOY37860.1 histidine phosphatase family protein [Anaerobacillus isosaccharinicus]